MAARRTCICLSMAPSSLPDRVRDACAWVAERARQVRVAEEAIAAYAATLGEPVEEPSPAPPGVDREGAAAFVLCLDAINFGSGWWPTIRRRPGLSGYSTIEAALLERFSARGPWTPAELTSLDAAALATALGQDPEHPLMAQYATALRDVGAHLGAEHGGSFAAVADSASGSAVSLAETLAAWDAFADASTYEGRPVPFFKRAQIAAADLHRAGLASFSDLGRLTAFADNLVPHVLRVDGVLRLDPELSARIDAEELLAHDSPEEVELRACAVHAVELLAASTGLCPAQVDALLWTRGRAPRYKSLPRPRCRTTAY
jgi:hypothetical protein